MELIKSLYWLLIMAIGSVMLIMVIWFLFALVISFWKTYCKKNSSNNFYNNNKI